MPPHNTLDRTAGRVRAPRPVNVNGWAAGTKSRVFTDLGVGASAPGDASEHSRPELRTVVECEYEIQPVRSGEGAGAVTNRADLVFKGTDGWRIVDFKTDAAIGKGALRAHAAQLAAYAAGLKSVLGGLSNRPGVLCVEAS